MGKKRLQAQDAKALAALFKAMGDPQRLVIMSLVQNAVAGTMRVSELTEQMPLSQPTITHHVRWLRERGLLERTRTGVYNNYSLTRLGLWVMRQLPDYQSALRGRIPA